MPRLGLTTETVVQTAADLVDERGAGRLTLAAVAGRLGVSAPSLYKHVHGLPELRTRLAALVVNQMTDQLRSATVGRRGEAALRAGMLAYRDYTLAHPERYAALPQEVPDDPVLAAAADRLLTTVLAMLRGYGLDKAQAVHAARCFRAAAHGFAALRRSGAFGLPQDLDESYERLVRAVVLGIAETAG